MGIVEIITDPASRASFIVGIDIEAQSGGAKTYDIVVTGPDGELARASYGKPLGTFDSQRDAFFAQYPQAVMRVGRVASRAA